MSSITSLAMFPFSETTQDLVERVMRRGDLAHGSSCRCAWCDDLKRQNRWLLTSAVERVGEQQEKEERDGE